MDLRDDPLMNRLKRKTSARGLVRGEFYFEPKNPKHNKIDPKIEKII